MTPADFIAKWQASTRNERAPTAGCRASRHAAAPSAADRASRHAAGRASGRRPRLSFRSQVVTRSAGRSRRSVPVRRLPDRYPPGDPSRSCGRRHVLLHRVSCGPRCDHRVDQAEAAPFGRPSPADRRAGTMGWHPAGSPRDLRRVAPVRGDDLGERRAGIILAEAAQHQHIAPALGHRVMRLQYAEFGHARSLPLPRQQQARPACGSAFHDWGEGERRGEKRPPRTNLGDKFREVIRPSRCTRGFCHARRMRQCIKPIGAMLQTGFTAPP